MRLGPWASSRLLVDLPAMKTTPTTASPPASYREAADALVRTAPPLPASTRRRLLDVAARAAHARRAA